MTMKRPAVLFRLLCACLVPAVLIVVGFSGCESGPTGDETGDPAAYAADVKTTVIRRMRQLEKDPTHAVQSMGTLVKFLADYESQPVGDHRQVYADLLAKCRELEGLHKQSAAADEIKAKSDEITALAEKLPGQLDLNEEEAVDAERE
jgi:hypothetical protein